MHSNDFDFMAHLNQGTLHIARDALALLDRLNSDGVLRKARSGQVPFGSTYFRAYTGLYAISDTVFQQASVGDSEAYCLYDALIAAWPEKIPAVSDSFIAGYLDWKSSQRDLPNLRERQVDIASYRRAREFVRACS